MYHRPVCVKCETELRPEKNGVGLLDYYRPSDEVEPKPYQIWDADLWKCPVCGIEIVVGFGDNPIDAHYNESFAKTIDGYKKYKLVENKGE